MYKYVILYSTEDGDIRYKEDKLDHPDVETVLDLQSDSVRSNWNEITIIDMREGDTHSMYERDGADEYEYSCTYRYI